MILRRFRFVMFWQMASAENVVTSFYGLSKWNLNSEKEQSCTVGNSLNVSDWVSCPQSSRGIIEYGLRKNEMQTSAPTERKGGERTHATDDWQPSLARPEGPQPRNSGVGFPSSSSSSPAWCVREIWRQRGRKSPPISGEFEAALTLSVVNPASLSSVAAASMLHRSETAAGRYQWHVLSVIHCGAGEERDHRMPRPRTRSAEGREAWNGGILTVRTLESIEELIDGRFDCV